MPSFNSQIRSLSLTLFISALLIFARPLSSSAALESSPAPQPSGDDISPPSPIPSPSPSPYPSSSPSPSVFSPPAPPPSVSPATAPGTDEKMSPTPAPAAAGGVNQPDVDDMESDEVSSGGMSGPKKAGVALGVIAGVCVVGFSGFVYKKRQQNLRRSQFGSAGRRDFI